jgi:hypothetical protein
MLSDIGAILEPGGVVILVTPNPACLANLTNDFWSDPTHQRLYTLDLLSFLLDQTGFDVREAAGNPLDVPGPPPEIVAPPLAADDWEVAATQVEPRGLIDYIDGQGMDGVLDELHRLRKAVEEMSYWQHAHDERLGVLRRFSEAVADTHNETVRFLYGPNEIYVVGERRP